MAINTKRVWLGTLVGGVVFNAWSIVTEFVLAPALEGRGQLPAAMQSGLFLGTPRLPFSLFFLIWIASLFAVAYGLAWAYAGVRATYGAGPETAVKLGLVMGFAAGFPLNFAHAVFQTLAATFWLVWMIEMVVGAVLAALAAAWVYRD